MTKPITLNPYIRNESRLSSIPYISPKSEFTSISLNNNPITSFNGLPSISTLTSLSIANTKISTFTNCAKQENLEVFHCEYTPLSGFKYMPLMALVAFGSPSLVINNKPSTKREKIIAEKISEQLRPLLVSGWIIIQLNPVIVINYETKQRKTIFSQRIDENDIQIPSVPHTPMKLPMKKLIEKRSPRRCSQAVRDKKDSVSERLSLQKSSSSQDMLGMIPQALSYHDFHESFASSRISFDDFMKLNNLK